MVGRDLFEHPIKERFVRKNVVARLYRSGVININGQKYVMYSMTEAIKKFRVDFPARHFSVSSELC